MNKNLYRKLMNFKDNWKENALAGLAALIIGGGALFTVAYMANHRINEVEKNRLALWNHEYVEEITAKEGTTYSGLANQYIPADIINKTGLDKAEHYIMIDLNETKNPAISIGKKILVPTGYPGEKPKK